MNAQEYQASLTKRHKHIGREHREEATCTCGWRATGTTRSERRNQMYDHLHKPD